MERQIEIVPPTVTKRVCAIHVPGPVTIVGDLAMPENPRALVVFAHGAGSSRNSPRNKRVAASLQTGGFATLLLDMLTPEEELVDAHTREFRFDIDLLAQRLVATRRWLSVQLPSLRVGYFGASTGGAAALIAAARAPESVFAVVSRGGRPDLAGAWLRQVRAPTLLLVGELDAEVLRLNEEARDKMTTTVSLEVVKGATHLFEEPGALDEVTRRAAGWFDRFAPRARH